MKLANGFRFVPKGNKKMMLFLLLLVGIAVPSILYVRKGINNFYQCSHESKVNFSELTEHVEVRIDKFGAPLIVSTNALDAIRALGYVTARDRFFQMDLMRRNVEGRLSEIIG